MLAHPESVPDWLKLFFLFVNAVPASPEPRLVHKRPMRGIHQPDDPVVNVGRQLARKMRNLVLLTENGKRWRSRNRFRKPRSWFIHIDPHVPIALLARIMSRKNALHFQFILRCQRRNLDTSSGARIKSPSVVAALHGLAIQPAVRKRHSPMRAR